MLPHPFHKSSFRPHLMMGAEHKPAIVLVLSCGGLALTSYNLVALGIALFLWLFFHPLLMLMAKTDPQLVGIYLRSLLYPRRIPAFTTPFRTSPGYRIRKA